MNKRTGWLLFLLLTVRIAWAVDPNANITRQPPTSVSAIGYGWAPTPGVWVPLLVNPDGSLLTSTSGTSTISGPSSIVNFPTPVPTSSTPVKNIIVLTSTPTPTITPTGTLTPSVTPTPANPPPTNSNIVYGSRNLNNSGYQKVGSFGVSGDYASMTLGVTIGVNTTCQLELVNPSNSGYTIQPISLSLSSKATSTPTPIQDIAYVGSTQNTGGTPVTLTVLPKSNQFPAFPGILRTFSAGPTPAPTKTICSLGTSFTNLVFSSAWGGGSSFTNINQCVLEPGQSMMIDFYDNTTFSTGVGSNSVLLFVLSMNVYPYPMQP